MKKNKYLKIQPTKQDPWCIVSFDAICLWDGNISEMEVGDTMIIEVVEMTQEQCEALPEFEGW